MAPGASKKMISGKVRAIMFAYGMCEHCGGFNHRAAECMARKKAQTFMAAGEAEMEVGPKECSEESGNVLFNPSRITLWLRRNFLL